MLQQARIAYKMIKYGVKVKMQVAMAVLFLAIGLLLEIETKAGNVLGGFYIVLSSMFVMQLILSVDMSTLVQTSPYKKKMQTSLPIMVCFPFITIAFLAEAMIRMYFFYLDPLVSQDAVMRMNVKTSFAGVIGLIFFTNIYFGVCYKFFVASMIGLILFIMPISFLFQTQHVVIKFGETPLWGMILIGYILIIMSLLISWLLTKLFYRKEMSKYAFGAALKKGL